MAAWGELNHIHRQRIAMAASYAVRPGVDVEFAIDGTPGNSYLVWRHRQRHVIAAGRRHEMERMLPQARAVFREKLSALRGASGYVVNAAKQESGFAEG